MQFRLRFALALVLACGLSGLTASTVSAKTIIGNNKPNTLVGTPGADVIYGKGGNDKIHGLGGNDRIYGGLGADTISCGPGVDTVYADKSDKIAKDCEHVIGGPKPPAPPAPPPPPPTQPPPPPPPPPAPTGPNVVAGHYCGFTNQGKSICFDVSSTGVANFRTESIVDCTPQGHGTVTLGNNAAVALAADGSFSFAYAGPIGTSDPGVTNDRIDYSVKGTIDSAGNANGTLSFNSNSFDYQGTHFNCSAAPFGWSAKVGA